ncbi:MAG: septum formation inhibitor Maf [Candidatus Solibacter sp.]|nr:septum formation inhibitor Maf [Candidatus Solibacter sp.]
MIVLASQSPRRREILLNAGFQLVVRPANVEEIPLRAEDPAAYVLRLAREKAAAAAADPEEFVLAADTTVAAAGHILEKPHSAQDAARMLRLLSGRTHQVLTGVCLRHRRREWSGVESTHVRFSILTEPEVLAYAASGEPMDKAGGYAIQGLASKFIDRIEGCYFNVVGLPVSLVYRFLKQAGYPF